MRRNFPLILTLMLAAPLAASADTLIIDGIEQARATSAERPTRGMSMDKVTARWGSPTSKDAAVGQPPITRWVYPDFVVYFEHDHVVHAVPKHS